MSRNSSDNENYDSDLEDAITGDESDSEGSGYDLRDPESEEVIREEMIHTLSQYGYQEDYDFEDPEQLEKACGEYHEAMELSFRRDEAVNHRDGAEFRLRLGESGSSISTEIKRVNSSLRNLALEKVVKLSRDGEYKEESRLLEEAPPETPVKKAGKRSSPNFSVIIDPNAINYTSQAQDVFVRRLKYAYKKAGQNPTPEKVLSILDDKKSPALRKKGGVRSSTSQNHVIADHYLSVVLGTMAEEIRILGNKPEYHQFSRDLSFQKKKAIHHFLDDIFSDKEVDKRQTAIDLLKAYFDKDAHDEELLKQFCKFVASNGSNNAAEGNSSVNSGVSQRMDAPLDRQGRLLPEFDRMRTAFLNLGEVFCKTFYHNVNEERQALITAAIGPNIVDGSVRASSNPRRSPLPRSLWGSFEDPGPSDDYLSGSGKVKGGKSISKTGKIKDQLTAAERRHIQHGYGYDRPSTPPPSFAPSSAATPKSSSKLKGYIMKERFQDRVGLGGEFDLSIQGDDLLLKYPLGSNLTAVYERIGGGPKYIEENTADSMIIRISKNQLQELVSHPLFNENGTFDDLAGRDNEFIFDRIKEEVSPRSQGR